MLISLWYTFSTSDGDSTGATVQESKDAYTNIANAHPSNVLALNHETYETTV